MAKKVTVFNFINHEFVPAGLLSFESSGRNSYSIFQYGKKYLQRDGALSIDPVHLPLQDKEFQTPDGFQVFNGIRDAGPDKWGRYLLDKKFKHALDEIDYILASSADRVGALAFGDHPNDRPKVLTPDGFKESKKGKRLDLKAMLTAIDTAIKGENEEKLKEFLEYGPSLGGARPKATVDWDGNLYIAKFSVSLDQRNEALIEYATMSLAKKCGLDVPRIEKTTIEMGSSSKRDIFLIERFDRKKIKHDVFYPVPFISALTVTGIYETDYQRWSYRSLCEAILRFSSDPIRDRKELFKRAVFNILVFNNDDHLRNHGFLYAGKDNWDLSPLYDVVPSTIHSETYTLSLVLGDEGKKASIRNAMSALHYFGVSKDEAKFMIEGMAAVVASWEEHFKECGVSRADIEKIRNSFRDKDSGADIGFKSDSDSGV